ncbi:4'-phosphopantetheinyl transferase family protein [Streptomyces sp. NPDC058372]|uniref:4'-phosphopantetheinyl transferase family protein n=1 Tax=Streptomyces sp. NPDC058372 TaxID=3346464 RepID=UPI00365CF2CA
MVRVPEHRASSADGLGLLDADERKRYADFRRSADRDRYAVGHVALRRLLGAYLSAAPDEVTLEREPCPLCGGPHGRPAVPGPGLHFSLSHSGELVLLAFAATPVGIDVEQALGAAAVDDVLASLHPREQLELVGHTPATRAEAVLRCWTRKEAYLKGTGEGLPGGPKRTYVGTGPQPAGVPGWRLSDVTVDPGHAAAIAVWTGDAMGDASPRAWAA